MMASDARTREDVPAPRYSVVIAAFNAEQTIASAIASALSQTEPEVEVIVVDDGSTDDTASVVQRLGDSRARVVCKDNRGPASARNAGIAQSRGQYVSFLDSDDLWLPQYLELAGEALERTVRPGFAYTDAYAFDPASGRVRRRTAMELMSPPSPPPEDPEEFMLELLRRNFVYNSATVPRSVLDDVGGYDESRAGTEDYELWLRILMRGYRAAWIPGQQALYRVHAGQLSLNELKMARDVLGTLRGLSSDALPTSAHRELLARRRRQVEHQVGVLEGGARLPRASRQLRQVLGRLRQRSGFGDSWYDAPPVEVAASFPDLRAV